MVVEAAYGGRSSLWWLWGQPVLIEADYGNRGSLWW